MAEFHASLSCSGQIANGLRRMKAREQLNPDSGGQTFHMDQYRNAIPELNQNQQQGDLPEQNIHFDGFSSNLSTSCIQPAGNFYNGTPLDVDLAKARGAVEDPPYDDVQSDDFIKVQASQGVFQTFAWPALIICVPVVLLCAALLFVVFNYLIKPVESIFNHQDAIKQFEDLGYLLVDFPATKLVFLASFLSTMAPLLAGCIMSLTAVLVYRDLRDSSDPSRFPQLPTPYQLSLLIGVLAASYEQLFSSFAYLMSPKRTAKASPFLLYALSIFLVSLLLSLAVTITDAYLHIATQTVSIRVYAEASTPAAELGTGINSYCLGVDRLINNNGYPCTEASTTELGQDSDWRIGQPEIQRLAHNTSLNSTIHLADTDQVASNRIAFLMPEQSLVPLQTNFEAQTIGVDSKCSLIPPASCNTTQWGDNGEYTSFNCSSQFWATLGLPPAKTTLGDNGKALSPYLSFLAINQNSNLIYNYFADEELEIVYNTADLNASAYQTDDFEPWPDNQLRNPVHVAFAWRTGKKSFAGSSKNGMVLSDQVQSYENAGYVDYFLNCQVSTYDVDLTWVNGSLNTISATRHSNGTTLNMWTGMADYVPSISATDANWQNYNTQSVIAGNTTASYEKRFGELLSKDGLSAIGAYSSRRRVPLQQDQTTKFVAKVPKSALIALLVCSLLYPMLGITLLVKALLARKRTGPTTPLFTYWGLTSAAFLERHNEQSLNDTGLSPTKPRDQEEALRLFIRNHRGQGDRFALWRRSRAGHIAEMQRSQTNLATWL